MNSAGTTMTSPRLKITTAMTMMAAFVESDIANSPMTKAPIPTVSHFSRLSGFRRLPRAYWAPMTATALAAEM